MKFGGLDLASKQKNPSGVCVYPTECKTVYSDEEVISFLRGADVVAVDAPLTYESPWRDSERELIRLGYRPLPLSMESMKILHKRARRISEQLGITVIETFVSPIRTRSLEVLSRKIGWNKHERDAFLASLVAKAFYEGRALPIGKEHTIYLVKKSYVEKEVRKVLSSL